MLSIVYAHGFRIGETLNMKTGDVDFNRMQVRVQNGKGRKWRNVPLSARQAKLLRKYLKQYAPKTCSLKNLKDVNIRREVREKF